MDDPAPLDGPALADLIVDLLTEGSATLAVAVPCLLVSNPYSAANAVARAEARLPASARRRPGLLYRLARSLAISRGPDLRHRIGHAPVLPPWAGEPADLPDPAERFGEACGREARDEEKHPEMAALAGDAERTFDQWLRILAVESGRP